MTGHRHQEAIALLHLGDTHQATGDAASARHVWRQALEILEALGHPNAEQARDKLQRLADQGEHLRGT